MCAQYLSKTKSITYFQKILYYPVKRHSQLTEIKEKSTISHTNKKTKKKQQKNKTNLKEIKIKKNKKQTNKQTKFFNIINILNKKILQTKI